MKSINVLVVTYNHEKYIGRFLDSVLQQKEYGLNKIILCDDQSKDNNVQVISEYVKKYPDIVELNVNKKNLGIYGNFNHLLDVKGDADLYYSSIILLRIWTALLAAPLRIWSPQHQRVRPFSSVRSSRILPTQTRS